MGFNKNGNLRVSGASSNIDEVGRMAHSIEYGIKEDSK